MKPFLYLLLSASTIFALAEGEREATLTYHKPSPCYVLEKYTLEGETLSIFLRLRDPSQICAQVIVEDRISLPEDMYKRIRSVEVYVNGRIWRRTEVNP